MKKKRIFLIGFILLIAGLICLDAQSTKPVLFRLRDIRDVSRTAPANGQVLAYVAATGLWTPAAAGGGDMFTAVYDPNTDGIIDISANTNLTVDANELTLTGDSLGLANHDTARSALGLAIGTNVQAYDADLTTWAGVTPSANGQSLVSAANYAAMRGLLDLEVGTDFNAYSANLATWSGVAPSANGQSLVAAANYAAMKGLLDLEIGTDIQAQNTVLTELTALTDPGADSFPFWNDTSNNFEWSTVVAPITGGLAVGAAGNAGKLEFEDADGDVFSLQVGAQGATTAYTLPTAFPGADGYNLSSTTAGVMSWRDSTAAMVWKPMAEDTVIVAGNGVMYFRVPPELNGLNVVSVWAHCYTPDDAADDISINIYNVTDTANILSTAMKIEGGEYDTLTSAQPGTIDGGHDDLATGDILRLDVTIYAGDNAAGLEIGIGVR